MSKRVPPGAWQQACSQGGSCHHIPLHTSYNPMATDVNASAVNANDVMLDLVLNVRYC